MFNFSSPKTTKNTLHFAVFINKKRVRNEIRWKVKKNKAGIRAKTTFVVSNVN